MAMAPNTNCTTALALACQALPPAMDLQSRTWIWEFFLIHCPHPRIIKALVPALPFPRDSPRLQRLLLLKSLSFDLQQDRISEETVDAIRALMELHRSEGTVGEGSDCKRTSEDRESEAQGGISDEGRRSLLWDAYVAVVLECTVQHLREEADNWPGFYYTLEKYWGDRVEDTEEREEKLDSARMARLKKELWQVQRQPDLRHALLNKYGRSSARELLKDVLAEAWKELGPPFLESVAENLSKGIYVPSRQSNFQRSKPKQSSKEEPELGETVGLDEALPSPIVENICRERVEDLSGSRKEKSDNGRMIASSVGAATSMPPKAALNRGGAAHLLGFVMEEALADGLSARRKSREIQKAHDLNSHTAVGAKYTRTLPSYIAQGGPSTLATKRKISFAQANVDTSQMGDEVQGNAVEAGTGARSHASSFQENIEFSAGPSRKKVKARRLDEARANTDEGIETLGVLKKIEGNLSGWKESVSMNLQENNTSLNEEAPVEVGSENIPLHLNCTRGTIEDSEVNNRLVSHSEAAEGSLFQQLHKNHPVALPLDADPRGIGGGTPEKQKSNEMGKEDSIVVVEIEDDDEIGEKESLTVLETEDEEERGSKLSPATCSELGLLGQAEHISLSPPPWKGSPDLHTRELMRTSRRKKWRIEYTSDAEDELEQAKEIRPPQGMTIVENAEILKAQLDLKESRSHLHAIVNDPLPEALIVAEQAAVLKQSVASPTNKLSSEPLATSSSKPSILAAKQANAALECKEFNGTDEAKLVFEQVGVVNAGLEAISNPCKNETKRFLDPCENQMKRSLMNRNPTAQTYEWEENDDITESLEKSPSSSRHVRLPRSSVRRHSPLRGMEATLSRPPCRRKTNKWTQDEEDALKKEVARYGKGRWKFILEKNISVFINRTEVDLKDKWRNIERREGIC